MIIDTTTKNTWNSNNKKYYTDKGYIFTKMYEEFDVKIEDLHPNSNKKINVVCDICKNNKILPYREYLLSIINGGYYACSQKCSNIKCQSTKFEKYNHKFFNNKKKAKKTCLEKYGYEYPTQNDNVKNKVKKTNLERRGVEHVFQDKKTKIKIEKSCLKKYGVKHVFQSEIVRNNYKEVCLKNLGVENPFQSEKIKNKIKETCLEKYGFNHHTKNKNIIDKITKTTIERYGEIWKNQVPKYNINSIKFLDLISEKIGILIQHASNGGEKHLGKYWIDGYIKEYSICLEWDERGHDTKKHQKYDSDRTKFLIDNYKCNVIRISEKNFMKNPDLYIDNIVNEIYGIKKKLLK